MRENILLFIVIAISISLGIFEFISWYRKNKNITEIVEKAISIIKDDIMETISNSIEFLKKSIVKYNTYEEFEMAVKEACYTAVRGLIDRKLPEYGIYISDKLLKRTVDLMVDSVEFSLEDYYNQTIIDTLENEVSSVEEIAEEDENMKTLKLEDSIEVGDTVNILSNINSVYEDK